jgi:saccharopine dehydrogenase (NAD+, L-lysine-forming)
MRILVIGAGGVGAAFGAIASRRDFFEQLIFADIDLGRAERAVAKIGDSRFGARAS